jgi:hypothetical protein
MAEKTKVAIVIPFYKEFVTESEHVSLEQLEKFLGKYDCFLVTPKSLINVPAGFSRVNFEDKYFLNVRSYSELLLTPEFYHKFNQYSHILIYQLDALVFSDQLPYWLEQKVSYIGAPWFSSLIGSLTSQTYELKGGNGGLSLRSVPDALQVLENTNKVATHYFPARWQQWAWFIFSLLLGKTKKQWLGCPANQYPFNEDGFWSFEAEKYSNTFRPASQKQSLQFAFETEPEKCFALNGQKLPFGVHAWEKYNKEFWIKKISKIASVIK